MSDRKHINSYKQSMLYNVLIKYKLIFDRTLGTCKTKSLDIELHPRAKNYHSKPYPAPRAQKDVLRKKSIMAVPTRGN